MKGIRKVWRGGKGRKVTVVSSGPMTNIALFVSVYPELVGSAVEEFVFMGGGVGLGNRSAVAEYNIMTDRESFFWTKKNNSRLSLHSSCSTDSARCTS